MATLSNHNHMQDEFFFKQIISKFTLDYNKSIEQEVNIITFNPKWSALG